MTEDTTTKLTATELLEKEGDVAADYLEGLLDIADLDGDIDIDVEGNRAMVSVVEASAGELGHLVGPDGKVLDALQELTRLAATRETGERSRLMLDVAGFRAQRRAELVALAQEAIAERVPCRTTGHCAPNRWRQPGAVGGGSLCQSCSRLATMIADKTPMPTSYSR